MTRPSKGAQVFTTVFGLMFMAFGLAFAKSLLFGDPSRIHGNLLAGVLFSAIFTLIGGGIIYAGIYGNRKLVERAAVAESNPESPWLWKKDWAANRAESRNRNNVFGLWAAAIFVNGIVFTIAISVVPQLWRTSAPKAFFPLIFCVVGVVLAVAAIRASIRRKRFGETYFEFASLPFSPGRMLKGTIHLRFNTSARHGIDLSLSCVRQVITGAGKNRSTLQSVLWQSDKNVPQSSLATGPMGDAAIPVEFAIPSDAYESNHDDPNDQVLWLLHAQADVPGVNYSDDFEVPVFRLAPSSASAPASIPASVWERAPVFPSDQQGATAQPAFQSDASDVPVPPNPKVVVSVAMDGSTDFYFPAFRNPSQVLLLIFFTAVWTAIVYFLAHSKAPFFFTAVFGLFELPLIYGLILFTLVSSRIRAGNGRILRRRALLGIGGSREFLFSEIAQILPVTKPQQPGSPASYSLRMQLKNGEKATLVDQIDNRQEARWIAAQLEKLAGLKLDTHVAVDTVLGGYGPPPQRGQSPSRSLARFGRNGPAAIAVGIAFFLAWTGFVGYRFFSRGYGKPARIARGAAPPKSLPRQVAHSPLTDTDLQHPDLQNLDLQHLQTLPAQAQAEELLDRAIRHDARALKLFEQNIGVWHDLQRTPQMTELERRSQFSTDLRVRYANADLNLAISGVPKTGAEADALIAQAQADPAHRAFSVYAMGMLAGRGVAYDRIYPILVDYAKHDSDPQVRQWAVEGMRYLGTDEALDQLFDSFTHDPSDAVRDRAGCNVSDCGNFMRKQRLRMVPRLIELARDSQTTPQMRNWTFLALQEITDASLPADPSAWQDWYAQHGAEKMAEFEHSDWWTVRGDQ
ncbi:MAG TPA: HEAT repeat domain-containing protein [Terriglobales bacterium]|nr:HEAT repeat domain-containing protein [Terriglobales bacterium]